MDPDKLLNARENRSSRFVRNPSSEGIVPFNWFRSRLKFLPFAITTVLVPRFVSCKIQMSRKHSLSLRRRPNSVGIAPTSLLPERSSDPTRSVREPSWEGIDPVSELLVNARVANHREYESVKIIRTKVKIKPKPFKNDLLNS